MPELLTDACFARGSAGIYDPVAGGSEYVLWQDSSYRITQVCAPCAATAIQRLCFMPELSCTAVCPALRCADLHWLDDVDAKVTHRFSARLRGSLSQRLIEHLAGFRCVCACVCSPTSAIAFEPMSGLADAFNNADHLAVIR